MTMPDDTRRHAALDADVAAPAEAPVAAYPRSMPMPAAPAAPRPAAAERLSGLYTRDRPGASPLALPDELRLDVDGDDPRMAASGLIRATSYRRVHWIAPLVAVGPGEWAGDIRFKDGSTEALPHTAVQLRLLRTGAAAPRLEATFTGTGLTPLAHAYEHRSPFFNRVEFEFDATSDANPAYAIDLHAHPNRPADLPAGTLTVADAFRRAGFEVQVNDAGGSVVPISGAGVNGVWSDTEMHDAMQAYWSRFGNRAQWALWVFSAALHEEGRSLGGVMFDSIGPNHRQGTAIFTESFIGDLPAGDPAAEAFRARMRFWTTVHEMGHAFNLAHSWDKQHPANWGTPWVPMADEPEARSFMNYPFNVAGGQTAFFADFRYRFSDQELLFMRHAPRRFVQMGNADWFDNHGFREAAVSPEPSLQLAVRMNRPKPALEFLEPAMIELKATNISGEPMVLDEHLLAGSHDLTLVVKRDGAPAKLWRPFATACRKPSRRVLAAGESLYHPLFVGAGPDGWLLAEPGRYTVQASLRLDTGEEVVSDPLCLKVLPPRGQEEEVVAQDLFTEPVGRVLAFDGTREMEAARDVLREAQERFPNRPVAAHAGVALGLPLRRNGKVLAGEGKPGAVEAVAAKPEEARTLLEGALVAKREAAAETLGHIEYREYSETLARWLAREGEVAEARKVVSGLEKTLAARKVKPAVLEAVRAFGEALDGQGGTAAPPPPPRQERGKGGGKRK